MSLDNNEYLNKLDQDISSRNLLTKMQQTIDHFQQELDNKPEEWIKDNKNAIIDLLDEEWFKIIGNQQIDIAGSYLYEDVITKKSDEDEGDENSRKATLIANVTGGMTGVSRGFGIMYYPTFVGGEFVDDYPKIIHLMYCDPVYDNELQMMVSRTVFSLPNEISVSLVSELNQDYLEEYTPDVLEDIDQAIYNAANYQEALQNLGRIKLDSKFAEENLRIALNNYVNKLLNLQSNLPYVISNMNYGFEAIEIPETKLQQEFPFKVCTDDSSKWFGYISSINIFNYSEKDNNANIIVKNYCGFVLSVVVVDGESESTIYIPLNYEIQIYRVDEVIK